MAQAPYLEKHANSEVSAVAHSEASAEDHFTWVDGTDFTASDTYLVLESAHIRSMTNDVVMSMKALVDGADPVAGTWQVSQEQPAGEPNQGMWMDLAYIASPAASVKLEVTSTGAATSEVFNWSRTMINLGDNTDYVQASNDGAGATVASSLTTVETITFTPGTSETWLIMGFAFVHGQGNTRMRCLLLDDADAGVEAHPRYKSPLRNAGVDTWAQPMSYAVYTGGDGTAETWEFQLNAENAATSERYGTYMIAVNVGGLSSNLKVKSLGAAFNPTTADVEEAVDTVVMDSTPSNPTVLIGFMCNDPAGSSVQGNGMAYWFTDDDDTTYEPSNWSRVVNDYQVFANHTLHGSVSNPTMINAVYESPDTATYKTYAEFDDATNLGQDPIIVAFELDATPAGGASHAFGNRRHVGKGQALVTGA